MPKEELFYIEDTHKRKLFYRFTPAVFISNFAPLLVVLHDERGVNAPHFEYKMWNVLTPIDDFGYENRGTCWLGEQGDFFLKDLLQELICKIAEEYECEDHIYLYGSGMGGYGAILHGILCKANAVYAHSPSIKLPPAKGTSTDMNRFYEAVFAKTVSKEQDLNNFLNAADAFPLFYLCEDSDSVQSSDEPVFEDEIAYFTDACKRHGIEYHLERCTKSGDDEEEVLKKVLDRLERIAP